jgi:ABC-type phosphate transport system substrate-binding protein
MVLYALMLLAMMVPTSPSAPSASRYRVIVHPKNPLPKVEKRFLQRAFLKKVTEWPDGAVIQPVDLRSDSATRRVFAEDVLNRSVGAVKSYWQQRIFSGRALPPPELDSEEAVVEYVLTHLGAVGYVSDRVDTRAVKVIAID